MAKRGRKSNEELRLMAVELLLKLGYGIESPGDRARDAADTKLRMFGISEDDFDIKDTEPVKSGNGYWVDVAIFVTNEELNRGGN